MNEKLKQLFHVSAEVRGALDAKRPVVALESTVISHGLPRPLNLETARRLEEIVRETGATPATIAVLKGRFHIGLDAAQLQYMAETDGIHKLSRRDLSVAVAKQWDGATTVATTMWIAHRAGIRVFATGGIGGVHRGPLPDVSADLPELARTPMIVVCSGAKIVLDLPATREWLETNGVTVVGYGCDEMPAFYTRRSGLPVDMRAETAGEVAQLALAHERLGMEGAILATVPVPEEAEVPSHLLQRSLDEALLEAERERITGRELTPFLLSRMANESAGRTLSANTSLLENNARVASEISKALSSST